MGKALVLKGVNFSVNKLDTVTFGDSIPCTGLSLSEDSITFTAFGTVQLTATKTPANTTDELTWVSSEPRIATVVDGLVTCVGLGTCTITAICGEQTATCSVTVQSITVDANAEYTYMNGVRYSGSYESPNKDYAGVTTLGRARCYYSDTAPASGYNAFVPSTQVPEYADMYPIKIPYGTNKIVINSRTAFTDGIGYALYDSTNHQTWVDNAENAAKCVGAVFYGSQSSYNTINLSDYQNADSFVFCPYAPSGTDASTITGDVSVTFSVS